MYALLGSTRETELSAEQVNGVGETLGLQPEQTGGLVNRLQEGGLVKWHWPGKVSLTQEGVMQSSGQAAGREVQIGPGGVYIGSGAVVSDPWRPTRLEKLGSQEHTGRQFASSDIHASGLPEQRQPRWLPIASPIQTACPGILESRHEDGQRVGYPLALQLQRWRNGGRQVEVRVSPAAGRISYMRSAPCSPVLVQKALSPATREHNLSKPLVHAM
jgi:hypothetical protein